MRLQSWAKQHSKLLLRVLGVLGIVFLVFGVPVLINLCYQMNAPFSALATEWEAADALSYYGSLLGAAATIYVLVNTIKFTVSNQKEERKLSIKPYLEVNKYRYTDLLNISDNDGISFLTVTKNVVTYSNGIPEEINNLKILHAKIPTEGPAKQILQSAYDYEYERLLQKQYYVYYEIQNCGAGNAIDVIFLVNGREAIPHFCVTTSAPKKLMMILNKDLLEKTNSKRYALKIEFKYSDIASLGKYVQSETIVFSVSDKNYLGTVQYSGQLLTKPTEVGELEV